jgi:hypothetical protein
LSYNSAFGSVTSSNSNFAFSPRQIQIGFRFRSKKAGESKGQKAARISAGRFFLHADAQAAHFISRVH